MFLMRPGRWSFDKMTNDESEAAELEPLALSFVVGHKACSRGAYEDLSNLLQNKHKTRAWRQMPSRRIDQAEQKR